MPSGTGSPARIACAATKWATNSPVITIYDAATGRTTFTAPLSGWHAGSVQNAGNGWLVETFVRHISKSAYTLFNLDETRPHDIRTGWGFIRLARRGPDHTLVSFGAMVGIDSGVVSAGLRPTLQEWILKVPLTMKWYMDRQRQPA